MIVLTLMAATLAQGQFEVCIAPDQPIPHVYVDDPLIIEFKSPVAATSEVRIEVTPDFAVDRCQVNLGAVTLHAGSTLWRPIPDVPALRGRYRLTARMRDSEARGVFCRIDRPGAPFTPLPVRVKLDPFTPDTGLALHAAGLRVVCMPVATPDSFTGIEAAMAAGFDVVGVAAQGIENLIPGSPRDSYHRIIGWEVDADDAETFIATAKMIRQAGSHAPILLALNETAALERMLPAGAGAHLDGVIFRAPWPGLADRDALVTTAEKAGFEDLPLYFSIETTDDAPGAGTQFARDSIRALDSLAGMDVRAELVYASSFGPAFVYLISAAQRLADRDYVGRLELPNGVESCVYRNNATWTIAFWTNEAATTEQEISVTVGEASELAWFDGRNNPLEVPPPKDGAITVVARPEPAFLTGKAGTVAAQAARAEVRREVEAILNAENVKKEIPGELLAIVGKFAAGESYTRVDFFNLLKVFPAVEELWHSGNVSRSVAVPALARLNRLAIRLAILEQERNEPFVEPLQSILADCGQRLSLYFTSSATSDTHQRSDWLLVEVNKLTERAEKAAGAGRAIEANALANVADWRARALVAAMRAEPLGLPEKVLTPKVAEPEAPTKQPGTDQKPQPAKQEKKPAAKSKKSSAKSRK